MKRIITAFCAVFLLMSAAEARGLVRIKSTTGRTAYVAASAAHNFQGFLNALGAKGYKVGFMGGWRAHGSCWGCNMHPRGLAIDIDQVGRNRCTKRFPKGVTALAARFGLLHGAVWNNPDTGHFEVASGRRHYASRHHRHHNNYYAMR